jgi:hypothetical protein
MIDPFDADPKSYFIPYADFLASIASIFLVVAALLTLYLHDPSKHKKDADIKSPGSVMVETFWKEDVDVDTWVKSPDDRPVGYSRKDGKDFDLLRDDLGMPYERVADHHHENVFARVSPAGEYIVNLHMYASRGKAVFPIAVEVEVTIKRGDQPIENVIHTTVNLMEEGQEVTVVRFKLNQQGELIRDSINHDSIPLRESTNN